MQVKGENSHEEREPLAKSHVDRVENIHQYRRRRANRARTDGRDVFVSKTIFSSAAFAELSFF